MNTLTPKRLAAMLGKMPEAKLRIFTLAPQLLTPQGKVDIEKCVDRHGDILPAIEEVRHYISDCHNARYRLEHIRSGSSDEDDWDVIDEDDETEDGE